MSNRNTISLINFFVFNSTYGPSEGEEHKKILYFYPTDEDLDNKIRSVGLCEAVVTFTTTFTEKQCQSIHTQKTRQLFYQPEKDFWLIMTVSIPSSPKTKDGQQYTEYHEEDVQDNVMEAVLQQAYRMFRLFMGSFYHILETGSLQGLKQRLEHFFSRYLVTLSLGQSDLLDIFNGITFLPLDRNTYLRIQCFVNALEANFSCIRHTVFMYNDSLVWSGLEQDDMRVLFRYLTTTLFPTNMEQELQGATSQQAGKQHYGRYITGPRSLSEDSGQVPVPHVFLTGGSPARAAAPYAASSTTPEQEDCHCVGIPISHHSTCPRACTDSDSISGEHVVLEECQLLVYKALSATVCMLLQGDFQPLTLEFFRRLDSFLGPKLSNLASDISEQYSKRTANAGETQFKFLYFNHMNLAEKSTVHADRKKTSNLNVSSDMLRLMADINHDLNRVTPVDDGETLIKTCTDCWLVAKKSDQREFYVVLNNKNANLIEINEEVKKVCSTHFNNIFFLD